MSPRRRKPTVGQMLRSLRQQRGWTIEHAAKMSGIPRTTLLSYEAGHTQVPANRLKILAKLYDVSIDYLLGEEETYTELARRHPEHFRILNRAARELPPERFEQLRQFMELFVEQGGKMSGFDWQKETERAQHEVQDGNNGEKGKTK